MQQKISSVVHANASMKKNNNNGRFFLLGFWILGIGFSKVYFVA